MQLSGRFLGFVLVISMLLAERAPAQGLEHQQAAPFSTSGLAVIAPTFSGSDGNTSFIRLANVGTTASTYTITVVGSPSGRTYGTTTYSVPAGASPQYSLSQILTKAGAAALSGGDDSYGLYLQDSDQYAGYQHVIYNGGNGFFENVSSCSTLLAPQVGGVLTNVHTSQLTAYPSQIRIHNYGTQPAIYRVTVTDAATGTSIGTVDLPLLAANATAVYQESYLEQQLHWTPTSSQLHANLAIAPVSGTNLYAVLSQYIFNQQFSAYVSMSEICAINARPSSSTGGTASASATFDGAIAGSLQTGTMSVSVQGAVATSAPLEFSAVERPRATLTATGTFRAAGASDVTLSGTFDTATGAIALTGGGYTFTGTVSNGTLAGSYTSSSGANGGFTGLQSGQTSVKTYCGTYVPGDDSGIFNVVVSANGSLTGLARSTSQNNGSTVLLIGQVNGASVSGQSSEGVLFTGSISGNSISGNFTSTNNKPGTFSGSTDCSIPVTSTGGSTGGGSTGGGTTTTNNLVVAAVATNASGSSVVVTAPFTIDGKTSQGSVTCAGSLSSTCGYGINSGTTVTLTATPGSGDTFIGWSGACSGTSSTCSFTLSATQQTATATFTSGQKHTLTLSSTGTGSATVKVNTGAGLSCSLGATCTGSFNGTVSVVVLPGTNTTFLGWGGACSGTGQCTVDLSARDQSVSAQFGSSTGSGSGGGSSGGSGSASSATLNLTVSRTGLGADGSITSSPAGISCSNLCSTAPHAFATGTTVTLTATPVSGSTFQGWGGACSGTGTCTVTMNSDQSVTASFSKP